jgi:ornithine decarboxylase
MRLDLARVLANLETIRASFGLLRPQVFYSCKANADPALLAALHAAGCGFDVASMNEIDRLRAAGVPTSTAIFSSTVKVPAHIAYAHAAGIDTFAFDSETELDKLAKHAPGARVVIRIDVPHQGSRWPLAGKFGVSSLEAVELLMSARDRGLKPLGVTFHVGSQCERTQSWCDAIELARKTVDLARESGIELTLLNIGGGMPARYGQEVPSAAEIGNEVLAAVISGFDPSMRYAIEPGRFLVADAGKIVTTVIGKALRRGKLWVYVDLSIYAGLLEVIGGWTYPIVTEKDHLPRVKTTLAGPTCDSTDLIAADIELPELEVGDRITLLSTGAYTTSYEGYNGFEFPRTIIVDEAVESREAA